MRSVGKLEDVVKRYKLPVMRSITKVIMYNLMTIVDTCYMVYIKVVKKRNPEFSSQEEKTMVFFYFFFLYLHEMMDVN